MLIYRIYLDKYCCILRGGMLQYSRRVCAGVLPPTADGLPPVEGVVRMVTYEGLFALIMAICAIISIVISILDRRNKK